MSSSDFVEGELAKHFFRTGNVAAVSVQAVALLTTLAADSDDGQFTTGTGVEVIGSYVKV